MYISGVPGTGKTSTLLAIKDRILKESAKNVNSKKRKIKTDFKFIEINGLRMTDPHQCYTQICLVS